MLMVPYGTTHLRLTTLPLVSVRADGKTVAERADVPPLKRTTHPCRNSDGFRSGMNIMVFVNRADVVAHRVRADAHVVGDLALGSQLRKQLEKFPFAGAEIGHAGTALRRKKDCTSRRATCGVIGEPPRGHRRTPAIISVRLCA